MLADQHEPVYGPNGYDTRTTWKLPAKVPANVAAEAARALALADYVLNDRADADLIAGWLGKLGIMVAANMPVEDARVKLAVFGGMLAGQYPRAIFTTDALDRAGRLFKWFPTYSEITERLDLELSRLKRERRKLADLAKAAKPEAPHETIVRSAVRRMPEVKASDAKPDPTPEKPSAIVHPPSAEQIQEWAKAVG